MKTIHAGFILFVIASVLVLGCQSDLPTETALAEASPVDMHPTPALHINDPNASEGLLELGRAAREGDAEALGALNAAHDESFAFRMELSQELRAARSWKEADANMQKLLERYTERDTRWLSRAHREQLVAGHMLHLDALRNAASPDARDAVVRYVDMLIRHESPEVSLVVEGLSALNGHLDREVHTAMSRRALRYAEGRLASMEPCDGCEGNTVTRAMPEAFPDDAAFPRARLSAAVEDLRRMAG